MGGIQFRWEKIRIYILQYVKKITQQDLFFWREAETSFEKNFTKPQNGTFERMVKKEFQETLCGFSVCDFE